MVSLRKCRETNTDPELMTAEDRLAKSTKSIAHPLQAIVLQGNELRRLIGTFFQITKKGGKGLKNSTPKYFQVCICEGLGIAYFIVY